MGVKKNQKKDTSNIGIGIDDNDKDPGITEQFPREEIDDSSSDFYGRTEGQRFRESEDFLNFDDEYE